jgi:Fe-S cluster biosynthesis and repair protein YggX
MTSLQDRIAQFRKMATDDPTNELAHFSLGKALLEDHQHAEAAQCFAETVRLNSDFSKAYQLQAQCLTQLGKKTEAIEVLRKGFAVADARGDRMPRDDMAGMLKELGEAPPTPKESAGQGPAGPGGFHCQRPGCPAGAHASQLPAPPINDDVGRQIYEHICTVCWREWLGMGIKVINEMRLDLSTEMGQQMYDQYMKEFLGMA